MKTNDPNAIVTIRDLAVAQDVSKAMGMAITTPIIITRTEGRGLFVLKPHKNGLTPTELKLLKQVAHGLRDWFKIRRGLLELDNGLRNRQSSNGRVVQPVPARNQSRQLHRPFRGECPTS